MYLNDFISQMKLPQSSGACGLAMTLYENISKSREKQKACSSHSQLSSCHSLPLRWVCSAAAGAPPASSLLPIIWGIKSRDWVCPHYGNSSDCCVVLRYPRRLLSSYGRVEEAVPLPWHVSTSIHPVPVAATDAWTSAASLSSGNKS